MQLHEVMMAIPAVEPLHPLRGAELLSSNPSSSASKSKKKTSSHIPVATPFCQPYPGEATNWKVGFSPPTEITLVGSWATETSVRGQDNALYGVDLAIEMPSVRAVKLEA
jgi:U3 small nucleolar RNA-associated protein 22